MKGMEKEGIQEVCCSPSFFLFTLFTFFLSFITLYVLSFTFLFSFTLFPSFLIFLFLSYSELAFPLFLLHHTHKQIKCCSHIQSYTFYVFFRFRGHFLSYYIFLFLVYSYAYSLSFSFSSSALFVFDIQTFFF